jgi:hypothetical protein
MKRIYYSFNKKKKRVERLEDALSNVEYVVSPYVKLDASIEECKIVELFEDKNLFVAYPIDVLGSVEFTAELSEGLWTGLIHLGQTGRFKRYFSIHGNVLYIGIADR